MGQGFDTPAAFYDRHVGRYGAELARRHIDFAGVAQGMRALDVGCGPGALTGELANVVGDDAVDAVEPSPTFASACRARHPAVRVHDAPAEALPFPDDSFDVALSQLVVNFMADAERGVAEMARVTRPGGTVSACTWDYADGMTLLRAFWDAAREVAPDAAAAADEGVVMRWCNQDELAALWSAAGLGAVEVGELVVSAQYDDFGDAWSPFPGGVGPSGAFCAALPADGQAALADAFKRRLGAGDGPFELHARAWAVRGTVG